MGKAGDAGEVGEKGDMGKAGDAGKDARSKTGKTGKTGRAKDAHSTAALTSALSSVPFTDQQHSFGFAAATTGKDTGYAVGYQFNIPPVRFMERNVDSKLQLRFGKSRRDMIGTVGFAIGF